MQANRSSVKRYYALYFPIYGYQPKERFKEQMTFKVTGIHAIQ